MKRLMSRLVPVLLPACMVDTPVVGSPDSGVGSDRLGANLGAWCDSLCPRLDACREPRSGDCVSECIDSFRGGFADKNDICTEAGLRAMDCYEKASCTELTRFNGCNVQGELELCVASLGFVVCDSAGGSEGGTSGVGGMPGGTGFSCNGLFEDCSNGSVYELVCDGPGDPPECSCMIDDEVVGRFILSRLECPETSEVARICGWPINEGGPVPDTEPPWWCHTNGSVDVPGGGDCSASFTNCSNGRSYEVVCQDTAPGVVDCTCFLDGEEYDRYQSAVGICPFVADLYDRATVATNYACGFNLSTLPVPK